MVSSLQSLLLLFHFCAFLSQLSELIWKLAEEISLQSASKRFPSFGLPANGNKSNAKKSWFLPNRNLTRTMYHRSVHQSWSDTLQESLEIARLPDTHSGSHWDVCRKFGECREIKRCEESKRTLKNPFASHLAEFNTTLKLLRITDQWYIVPVKFWFGKKSGFFGITFMAVGRRSKRWEALWCRLKAYFFC